MNSVLTIEPTAHTQPAPGVAGQTQSDVPLSAPSATRHAKSDQLICGPTPSFSRCGMTHLRAQDSVTADEPLPLAKDHPLAIASREALYAAQATIVRAHGKLSRGIMDIERCVEITIHVACEAGFRGLAYLERDVAEKVQALLGQSDAIVVKAIPVPSLPTERVVMAKAAFEVRTR